MTFALDRRRLLIRGGAVASSMYMQQSAWCQSSAQTNGDLIIFLPGIAGTTLSTRWRASWDPSLKGISTAILSLGASLRELQLTEGEELDDGVQSGQLVSDIHLIPGLWRIDGYTKLISTLSSLPCIKPNQNFFTFPYDWRKDNREAARRLAKQAHTWLQAWRRESGNADARLVLVAHSMGGLVSRYFLECLEGWKSTRKLITFGTPYRGSLNALDILSGGVKIGPVQLEGLSTLPRSFTSIYQLLPTY